MLYTGHIHKFVKLRCILDSADQKEKKIKLRPPLDDWNQNLPFLVDKVKAKFKCLHEMKEDEWTLSVGGVIVDKSDSSKFKEVISKIAPIPIIDVVRVEV